jgi:hypothetical protein
MPILLSSRRTSPLVFDRMQARIYLDLAARFMAPGNLSNRNLLANVDFLGVPDLSHPLICWLSVPANKKSSLVT